LRGVELLDGVCEPWFIRVNYIEQNIAVAGLEDSTPFNGRVGYAVFIDERALFAVEVNEEPLVTAAFKLEMVGREGRHLQPDVVVVRASHCSALGFKFEALFFLLVRMYD